ncbi:MAG: recombinase family protein [Nocardioidaceae bacterium]|nr:recombinase family protein [Nocardioidaceae bacterium]
MSRIEATHLRRWACVYVRQSTMAQVEHNRESLERQYELADRAVALGWAAGEVVVVDSDLGRSGKTVEGRDGFQRLVADVGLGKVGIVLGIEVSRLARSNADWYQLLDLCALTDTLIADQDGIYHPGLHNDRLLLGLKGTMSEAELHVLRARMRDGLLHKAAKGKLRVALPVGYEYDASGQVRIAADEVVADAVATVFAYFEQLASARQVLLRLLAEDRRLPRPARRRGGQVRWAAPTYKAVHAILTNPCYAGVYAYGRRRVQRRVVDGVVSERMRRAATSEEWLVCLRDHHPSYISFQTWEANQARLHANWSAAPDATGAAREGRGLLQGLVRCGRCGRRMGVSYSGRSLTPRYHCARAEQQYGAARCQSGIGGGRVERAVLDAVFQALAPAAIDATLAAIADLDSTHQASVRSAELELERAAYEADRARRQFDGCEPENRLVARTLESEWEQRLQQVGNAERTLAAVRARRPQPLNEQEIAWCRHFGADLRAAFDAPTTTDRDRKLLIRAMITEIQLVIEREQQRARLRIVWEGGAITEHEITVRPAGSQMRTDEDTLALVRRLAVDHPDREIAGILARQGRLTGAGNPFTVHRVRSLRHHHDIPAATVKTDPGPGEAFVTVAGAAAQLGVSTATVHRWLREGFITGRQVTPGAAWQILITDELRDRVCQTAPDGWLALQDAATALGVARQTVLHKVQRGEIPAVYVQHGKRKGLRIQVKPVQTGLFDNNDQQEAQC